MTNNISESKPKSSAQIVARQRMKSHLRHIRNREYTRLRDLVPAIANKQQVSKVTVIEEAVRYIDELHKALASRLDSKVTNGCQGNDKAVINIVHSIIPAGVFERRASVVEFEKQQRKPTYLLKYRSKMSPQIV